MTPSIHAPQRMTERRRLALIFAGVAVAIFAVLTVADTARATNTDTCTEERQVPIYVKWVRERKNVNAPWGDWYLYDGGSVTSLSPGSGYLSPLMQYEYRESGRTMTDVVKVPCATTTTAAPATTTTEAPPSTSTSPSTSTTAPAPSTSTTSSTTPSPSTETSVVPPSSVPVPPSTPSSEPIPAGNCQPTGECNPTPPSLIPPESSPPSAAGPGSPVPAGPTETTGTSSSRLPATGPVTDGIIPAATAGLIGGLALVAIARRRKPS